MGTLTRIVTGAQGEMESPGWIRSLQMPHRESYLAFMIS